MSRTVSNIISSIVFGDRFEYDNKEFLSLLGMMMRSFQFTATSTGQVTTSSLSWSPYEILPQNPGLATSASTKHPSLDMISSDTLPSWTAK